MGKFLETWNLPKLNKKETENLNRPITTNEIKAVKIKLSKNKSPRLNGFTCEFYQTFRKLIPILLKLFQKFQEEERLKTSFYKATIILIPKPDKNTTKIGNYRPKSMKDIKAKILNKVLANLIQQYIKKIRHCDQMEFISGMQGWCNICKSINMTHYKKKRRI